MEDTDNDSVLMLRQMYLTTRTSSTNGPAGGLLLPGAPNGPNGVQQEPERSEVLWVTRAYIQWANALHHSLIKFDECRLGQVVVKSTTLSTDLPPHHWHDLRCNHGASGGKSSTPVSQRTSPWWVNKVGTYGMASAQSYWGRLAALLLRVLYALFPQVDWNGAVNLAVALLATLLALGTPLSWKKTHLAEVNTWLGFVVHPNIPQVLMAANKHILVMEVLQTMVEGQAMHSNDIEKALGRIQWATAACPLAKSMLQPLWAWKMATTTVGKPPKVVRMLAFMLRFLFNTPFVQYSPYLPKSSWWRCSDASASDEGLAFVGGWCSTKMEPEKKEVYWFHEQIHVEEYPWAFKNGDPKRRIAALEMLARSSSVT